MLVRGLGAHALAHARRELLARLARGERLAQRLARRRRGRNVRRMGIYTVRESRKRLLADRRATMPIVMAVMALCGRGSHLCGALQPLRLGAELESLGGVGVAALAPPRVCRLELIDLL